jgi:hypothetical protein
MRNAFAFKLLPESSGRHEAECQRRFSYRPSGSQPGSEAGLRQPQSGRAIRKWGAAGRALSAVRISHGVQMKPAMLKILVASVTILVIAWLASNHLDHAPSLGYQVSDPIEIGNPFGGTEYVQEIAVFNSGRVMAKAVSIKVPQGISSYQLTKHTNLVKEASINNTDRFELLYPELPPDQRISLVVHYGGNPIPRDWITVSNSGGYVQPQGKAPRELSPFHLGFLFLGGFLFSSLLQIRKQHQSEFSRVADDDQLLRNDKPWFVTRDGWPNLQFAAIASRLSVPQASDPGASFAYKILNHEKPQLIRDEQWSEIKTLACDRLVTEFFRVSLQGANVEKLLQWAKLVKPEMLPWHDWQKYQQVVGERLFELLLPRDSGEVDYDKLLAPGAVALHGMPDSLQDQLRSAAQKRYLSQLIVRSTESSGNPSVILQTAKLSYLNDDQKLCFQNHIEQLARMRSMPRGWDLAELAAFLASGRPEWMVEGEFLAMSKLVKSLENLNDDREILELREQQARNTQMYADKLRKRALAQLGLIDRVLTNPEAVDTLEDYAESLEPAYRKSLERIAWLLRRANHPTVEKKPLASVSSHKGARKS